MGQYYSPVSLDAKEWIYSHDYENGLKLMEHSWISNNFVSAVENLLSPKNSWHKTRIVWAGDYGDKKQYLDGFSHVEEYMEEDDEESKVIHNVHTYADKYFKKVKPENVTHDSSLRYLVNHSKNEYVDLTKCQVREMWEREWRVHPLPLLTASGNGRGGGDYHGNNLHYVGTWAGDVISMERKVSSKNLIEIIPDFYE